MLAIEVKDLFFSYSKMKFGPRAPILKGVSLQVFKGEMVAIQGPSGSGKSTLLYLLGLLAKAQSGQISLVGHDVTSLSDDELAMWRNQKIGFVFQQFHLLPQASVLENILLATQYSTASPVSTGNRHLTNAIHKAIQLAEKMGLAERLSHRPNQLSGGEQQRVAICRALMNDPEIILADEPTGNLDSQNADQILTLFRQLNMELGKTVVLITHDNEVAKKCDRIISFRDGKVASDSVSTSSAKSTEKNISKDAVKSAEKNTVTTTVTTTMKNKTKELLKKRGTWRAINLVSIFSVLQNLGRHKIRTALTMVGISVGIAAVLSMITLGQYTKQKILAGYAEMGVNTLLFYGYPSWDQKATDIVPIPFVAFDWEKDIQPLKKIFPEIQALSPILMSWNGEVYFGGRVIEQDLRAIGVSDETLGITERKLLAGRNFSAAEIEQKSAVCIIGYEIASRLFFDTQPLGQMVGVKQGDNSFGCRVIGVLASTTSNKEYLKPNLQIFFPYTYFQALSGDWWSSQIHEVLIRVQMGADVEIIAKGIRYFFEKKYGASGRFRVDSDSVLLSQMQRFLSLFTLLLSSIAFVTLSVGGIGITNMMLVTVSERFREIGLRKALGATRKEIRFQFLAESILVCCLAGLIGLGFGFGIYEGAIWVATQFVNKIKFEWVFDGLAFSLSIIAIFAVGILSGIFPAIKAEKLQVIEALRSE